MHFSYKASLLTYAQQRNKFQKCVRVRKYPYGFCCISTICIWNWFRFTFKQCYPLGSSYLVGKVLNIGLQNSLSLTMIPFLIYFQSGVTFPLVALDKNFINNAKCPKL